MTRVVKLKGDYTKRFERQAQAKEYNCDIVISFHFNAAVSSRAAGAEVYFNNKDCAKKTAEEMLKAIIDVLGVRNRGVKSATNTRASFINRYHCPAVLLEPLFISNPSEAKLVHDLPTVNRLAHALAKVVSGRFRCIGVDVGHLFKTSNKNDKGAKCAFKDGCFEAFHAEQLADAFIEEIRKAG